MKTKEKVLTARLTNCRKEKLILDELGLMAEHLNIPCSELYAKSKITYFVLPGKTVVENIEHITYGIGVMHNNVMIASIPDITTEFNKLKNLVLTCNENDLSLTHLEDVVEDFLE